MAARPRKRSSWAPMSAPSRAKATAPGSCITARISRPAVSRDARPGLGENRYGRNGLVTDEHHGEPAAAPQRQAGAGVADLASAWSTSAVAERAGDERLRRDGQGVQGEGERGEQLDEHLVGGQRRRVDVRGDERGRVHTAYIASERTARWTAGEQHRPVADPRRAGADRVRQQHADEPQPRRTPGRSPCSRPIRRSRGGGRTRRSSSRTTFTRLATTTMISGLRRSLIPRITPCPTRAMSTNGRPTALMRRYRTAFSSTRRGRPAPSTAAVPPRRR